MKSKNIPPDIRIKSIKEAQNEIKEIMNKLEKSETNLEETMEQYNRMIQLNHHIHDQFKKKSKEINKQTASKRKKESLKN